MDIDNTFFTADPHFYHKNIIKYCDRPFKHIEEMNDKIINNFNTKVNHDSIIYILGDFCLTSDIKAVINIFRRLKGSIYFIPGGHDFNWIKKAHLPILGNHNTANLFYNPVSLEYFYTRSDGYVSILPQIYYIESKTPEEYKDFFGKKLRMFLSHVPLETWAGSYHKNSFNLHGHSHGNSRIIPRRIDIGVDCNNFHPFSLREILEMTSNKEK